jgi:hypothetical protein
MLTVCSAISFVMKLVWYNLLTYTCVYMYFQWMVETPDSEFWDKQGDDGKKLYPLLCRAARKLSKTSTFKSGAKDHSWTSRTNVIDHLAIAMSWVLFKQHFFNEFLLPIIFCLGKYHGCKKYTWGTIMTEFPDVALRFLFLAQKIRLSTEVGHKMASPCMCLFIDVYVYIIMCVL